MSRPEHPAASCCPTFAAGLGVHYSNCENYDPAKDAEGLPAALAELERRTASAATNHESPPLSGLEPDEQAIMDSFVGKKLVRYSQAPNRGNFDSGDWRDDEPLRLEFEDGSVLVVQVSGWHDSGGLWVSRG